MVADMSDDDKITAGDLVVVVKPTPCCKHTADLGTIFTVLSVEFCGATCTYCGETVVATIALIDGGGGYGHLVSTLRKLRKPGKDEETTKPKELEVV